MMKCATNILFLALAALLFTACSDAPRKGKANPNVFPNSQNGATNDDPGPGPDPANCGDGGLNPGETCDPAIPEGSTGACPTSCDAPDACSTATTVGVAESCTLECVIEPVACADGDGCCPAGCDGSTDADCDNTCGDGVTEGPEVCDGNCPTMCNDADACTTDTLTGSADLCSAVCSFTRQEACVDDDNCCPTGCEGRDNDCACVPEGDACVERECGSATDSCGSTVSCGTCPGGESCVSGVCETNVVPNSIGDACLRNSDCASGENCLGPPQGLFVGGYCSKSCNSDSNCPTGSVCTSNGDCLKSCRSDSDCSRREHLCASFSDVSTDICVSGGIGTGLIGDRCSDVTDCAGDESAVCFTGEPGGYCSLQCASDSDCGANAHCAPGSNVRFCLDTCSSNFDCRSGWVCLDSDLDGNTECRPDLNGPGDVGDPCTVSTDCGGGGYGFCATGANFPNGACTLVCEPGTGTCGAGEVCVPDFNNSICMAGCSNDSDCRTGYTCETDSNGANFCVKV